MFDVTLRFQSGEKVSTPDPVWPDRAIGEFPASREYFGVEIPRSYFNKVLNQVLSGDREEFGSVLDDWRRGSPLLQKDAPWPPHSPETGQDALAP